VDVFLGLKNPRLSPFAPSSLVILNYGGQVGAMASRLRYVSNASRETLCCSLAASKPQRSGRDNRAD
jgi:hypothetical protein